MTSTAWGGYANGEIPLSALALIPGTNQYIKKELLPGLVKLMADFKVRFGKVLPIIEAYRNLGTEQYLWDGWQKRLAGVPGFEHFNLAARPGTSLHGWALSVDFGGGVDEFGTEEKAWMDEHAPAAGFEPTGNTFSPREAWHYDGTGTISPAYLHEVKIIPNSTTASKKREEAMNFVYVDEQVVDVPGKAGVRNATYKTQRTWVQYGESFYKEFTASQETANGFAGQSGGNAFEVNRAFLNSIQASQADARNKLAAAIAAAIKK